MGILRWLFGRKEPISDKAVEHSSKGEYVANGSRLKGGGHGQEAIDYMDNNDIEYNIVKTYKNGVRVGNVPRHKNAQKQKGTGQTWFPKTWGRSKIKKAGQVAANGKKSVDTEIYSARYDGVNVGIKRTKGAISTVFPTHEQPNRKGGNKNGRKKTSRANSSRKK